jgi:signal transduction histidine kinase
MAFWKAKVSLSILTERLRGTNSYIAECKQKRRKVKLKMTASQPFLSLRRSAPAKLALIAALFVIAVVVVRALSLGSLANVDEVSSEIRNRWLDSVQILGTLRHHVARVRTEEAEILLGGDAAAREESETALSQYLKLAGQDIENYQKVPHDLDEAGAFNKFVSDWNVHKQRERELTALASGGKIAGAISLFHGEALQTFRLAARELHQLLVLTHAKAETARAHAAESIASAQRFISDLILAMLALFVGLAFYLWRSFSRPLLDLASGMHRLAINDTSFAIPFESRRDEIGEMARSLQVLKGNTVELLETRQSLALQAELLAGTLEKERGLATEQRNFLTTMSHEFRTPLTYIDGHAQRLLAAKDRATAEQIVERVEKIRSAVFQMTSLVASLTAGMEIAAGPVHAEKASFDPSRMLHGVIEYYRKIGLKVQFDERLSGLPETATGDPKLLKCAFSNLISNAIKYSPEGSHIAISGRTENGTIAISVEDQGIGIPPAELNRVRERFYRGSNVGSIPGTGVGLSLVQQIIEQHGGQMSIDSALGQGTRVAVTLPFEAAASAELRV